ncbi:MAG: ATP-dependent endonuclease [Rubrivivax sp.]|nr:MAG: ATP-dependent endonuclease [Rubrivivax sp.]
MHIEFVEIANFRKLLSARVDLSQKTTLFVGANNSGKTSAMLALRRFLTPQRCAFEIHDFTLCHLGSLIDIGEAWIQAHQTSVKADLSLDAWMQALPTLDIWLHVEEDEVHRVRDLVPLMEWTGGRLGVRLRYEPKDLNALFKDFITAITEANAMREAAAAAAAAKGVGTKLTVWPETLVDFLTKRLNSMFTIRVYPLDPDLLAAPKKLQALPQKLPTSALPIDGDPLGGLIKVHDIPAQRGFGEIPSGFEEDGELKASAGGTRLSEQLRSYYSKHLDPAKGPDPMDLEALQAMEAAEDAFDLKLTESFSECFTEVAGLGYPGVSDPRPRVSTRLRAIDGLNHSAAVNFEVDMVSDAGSVTPLLLLPEGSNGLGYQNLISMIFRLMSFRDAWMRIGKASKGTEAASIEPLHLVLVEEPEAHLHAQVQQVFIKKAYEVLRRRPELGENDALRTQLIVSTHSSHVAHETPFASLRYFRRLPAGMVAKVPVSTVVNLSQVFGDGTKTERFVSRYLRAQHADLFFADAAILVEGPAERMLIPNFIRAHYQVLHQSYVTLLEIGGSHAHRLRPLIDHLGLSTLIVTDLDSLTGTGGSSVQPALGAGQKTNNATLKTWVPELDDIDALMGAAPAAKTISDADDTLFAVRAAYQIPVDVTMPGATAKETAYPYTFEDALVFENMDFFATFAGPGLNAKFRTAIANGGGVAAVGASMFEALKDGKKAEFALDVLMADEFNSLKVPTYIAEGLEWLLEQMKKKQVEILTTAPATAVPVPAAAVPALGSTP